MLPEDLCTQAGSELELARNCAEALSLHWQEPMSSLRLSAEGLLLAPPQATSNLVFDLPAPAVDQDKQDARLARQLGAQQADAPVAAVVAIMPFARMRLTLQARGFTRIDQLGNHVKLSTVTGTAVRTAILPHYQELSPAVVASICRQSGLPWSVFA